MYIKLDIFAKIVINNKIFSNYFPMSRRRHVQQPSINIPTHPVISPESHPQLYVYIMEGINHQLAEIFSAIDTPLNFE